MRARAQDAGMYRTILVPVDGSATATRGLREALRVAKGHRSKLVLLHVVATPYLDDALLADPSLPAEIQALMRKQGKKVLDRASAQARRAGVAASSVLVEKPGLTTADQILREAKKRGASLIVMGTHGRRGVRRLVLGSDAEQVVRLAPTPVLLVRAR